MINPPAMAYPENVTVSNLLPYIQWHDQDDVNPLPPCVNRERYLNGPQYYCPILDAMKRTSDDAAFVNLVSHLMDNSCPMTLEFKELNKNVTQLPKFYIEEYPIKPTMFVLRKDLESKGEQGQGASRPNKVTVDSPSESDIKSMTFQAHIRQSWENSSNRFRISIECDHWITAVKINLLICNIFKLSFDDNCHTSEALELNPVDGEQFIDIMEFLVKPHAFEDAITESLEKLLLNVLGSSEIYLQLLKLGDLRDAREARKKW